MLHGAANRDRLTDVARSFLEVRRHRDSDPDGITVITRRPVTPCARSTAGFTDGELWPHTEGSSMPEPPHLLMMSCVQPADTGGHIQLVDGCSLYQAIAETDPTMLAALRAPRSAYFGGATGHLGTVFHRVDAGRLTVRLRLDDQIVFAPDLRRHVDRLRSLVRELTVAVVTREGNGYVVLNDRWLHGRSRFTGPRRMLRLIGNRQPGIPLLSGFADPALATRTTAA